MDRSVVEVQLDRRHYFAFMPVQEGLTVTSHSYVDDRNLFSQVNAVASSLTKIFRVVIVKKLCQGVPLDDGSLLIARLYKMMLCSMTDHHRI
jgi:hypothetical protein